MCHCGALVMETERNACRGFSTQQCVGARMSRGASTAGPAGCRYHATHRTFRHTESQSRAEPVRSSRGWSAPNVDAHKLVRRRERAWTVGGELVSSIVAWNAGRSLP